MTSWHDIQKKKEKQWCVWSPWCHRLRLNALTWRDVQNAYMQGISKWLVAPLQPISYGFVDFCWSIYESWIYLEVAKQQNTSTSIQKLWKMMCPLGLCLLVDVEPTKHSGPCWLNPSSFLCLWAGSPSTTKSGRSLEWINSIAGYGVLPEDTGDVTPLENFEHPWWRFSKRRLKQLPFSSSVQIGVYRLFQPLGHVAGFTHLYLENPSSRQFQGTAGPGSSFVSGGQGLIKQTMHRWFCGWFSFGGSAPTAVSTKRALSEVMVD